MTVAGDIVANLTVNSKGWSAGLKDAITPLTAFSTAVLGMAAAGVYKFNEIGSAIDDMSQRTGVSAETLGGLSYAAKLTDTSLESLQSGLVKQSKFMESLDSGSSSAAATLKRLGLSADDLAGKTADQQLMVFADSLAAIENVGERSAVAMSVFGKGAVDLIPLLSQGGEGIQQLIERAEDLGVILSSDDVKAAAAFGDAFDELVLVGEMFLAKVVGPMVPMLTKAATSIAEFGAKLQPAIVNIVDLIASGIEAVGPYIESFVSRAANMLNNLANNARLFWDVLKAGGQTLMKITAGIVRVGQLVLDPLGFAAWAFGADEATEPTKQLEVVTESATVAKTLDKQAAERQADAYKQLVRNLQDADKVHARLNKQLQTPAQQAIADAQQLADDWWKASRAGSQLGMRFEDLKRLQTKTLEDKSGFSGMFTDITDELRVLRGEITETELKFEQMAEFGVSDKQIQKLREANAERDKLLAEQQQRKDEESAAANRISSIQKTVRDSFGTPLDDFIEKAKGVEDAINAGALTKAEGNAYLEAERKKLLDESAKELETPEQRKAALTEAISVNSDAGNRMLVDLMNRKGGGQTLDEKQLTLQQQQKKLAEQTLAAMEAVKENTSKPQLATKPFRAGA